MLAPARQPLRYRLFNLRWGAPYGRVIRGVVRGRNRATWWGGRLAGPFALQSNNTTRRFEYPWIYEALQVRPGLRVLEIGGGLSGFQFVLDRQGCEVTDVDPGGEQFPSVLPSTPASVEVLNKVFGTKVRFFKDYLEALALPANSFDRVFSISVFEHIPEAGLASLMPEVARVLKPGGLLVMTVDLFLNVHPFAEQRTNEFGQNVSIKWLAEISGLELVHGRPSQLFGYSEFDPNWVMQNRASLLVGKYPSMVQTVVLRKPAGAR